MAIFEEFNQASIFKLLSLHGGRPTGVSRKEQELCLSGHSSCSLVHCISLFFIFCKQDPSVYKLYNIIKYSHDIFSYAAWVSLLYMPPVFLSPLFLIVPKVLP